MDPTGPRRPSQPNPHAATAHQALGLEEDRTRDVVDRLIGLQWPDGGWNCDKRPEAMHSSFQESLIPARGLWAYGRAHDYAPALEAAQKVADLMLPRRLLWHRSDGSLIVPDWAGKPGPDRIHYPIQFFDVLFALQVMADLGRLGDPRCFDALELLDSKRLPGGGFPREAPTTVTADHVVSRGSYAEWGPTGLRRHNPLVALAALAVLGARTGHQEVDPQGRLPAPGPYRRPQAPATALWPPNSPTPASSSSATWPD